MPDLVTLEKIVDTFTEQELDFVVPIDFKDVDSESLPYINTYNGYLASKKYEEAYQYRLDNADILEPLIIDAKKLNIMMSIIINTYLFAKGERSAKNLIFDNSFDNRMQATNIQDAIEEMVMVITQVVEYLYNEIEKTRNRHVFVEELPAEPDPDTFYYLEEE